MRRSILHMDLDTFFVSCERLIDSRLKNKPVIIGGTSDRGVVSSCSYEARRFGVHSAMPIRMAKQLCPEGIYLRGTSGIYTKYSNLVTDIIKDTVPVYEKSSIDEFYVDLTGMDQFFGNIGLASELRKRIIKESGLPISFGLSLNKTVSKIATGEAKPNNEIVIKTGGEKPFLAPLSVRKIPMVGEQSYKMLRDLGVRRILTIQEMPLDLLVGVFGKNGKSIWKKANGIDHSPVVPYSEQKSMSVERTFDKDTTNFQMLQNILIAMGENLAYQLRQKNKLTACITVKLRYSDFQTFTKQIKIPYTAADHAIIPVIKELYQKLYTRRVRIRLVGIRFSHLVGGGHQINLFEDVKLLQLYQAMDKMRDRYGENVLVKASSIDTKFKNRPNPFNGK